MSQPFSVQAQRNAACFPEQLKASLDLPRSERTSQFRAVSSSGHAAGHWSCSSLTPAALSMPSTTSMWSSEPTWLPQAIAACAPRRGTPACMEARACSGFSVDLA